MMEKQLESKYLVPIRSTATAGRPPSAVAAGHTRDWLSIALLNFFFAACLGALLRLAFVIEIPFIDYRHVLHGHSHVAMLGWIYMGLYALLINQFVPDENQGSRFYWWLFWITEVSVIGMLVAFPLQGYATWSVIFSSLHIFCSYAFAWRLWRDSKGTENDRLSPSRIMMRLSLVFMVISTIGVWAVPPIAAQGLLGSAIYYASVQFFLHFQFNGWFIFAGLALLFRFLENNGVIIDRRLFGWFFGSLIASCILTYALAVTWSTPWPALFYTNSIGVFLQVVALGLLIRLAKPHWHVFREKLDARSQGLIFFAIFCLAIKMLMQFAVVIPTFATTAYTIRNFVIGFIHLMMLGMMSSIILGLAIQYRILNLELKHQRIGLNVFVAGIVLSELVLFGQGIFLWAAIGFFSWYYEAIFAVSVLIPIGILLMWIGASRSSTSAPYEVRGSARKRGTFAKT